MFYRLLSAETLSPLEPRAVSPLPLVSAETRGRIVQRIDQIGSESFTHDAIDRIEATVRKLDDRQGEAVPLRLASLPVARPTFRVGWYRSMNRGRVR
jgi:hypothetical protein